MNTKHYAYIVQCRDGVLYTGYTNNLEERVAKHNRGLGAKFTRGRGPVQVVYFEEFGSKEEAMVTEARIKRMTREQKLRMIAVMSNAGE